MDTLELLARQTSVWGLSLDSHRLARLEAFARLLSGYEEANVIGTRTLRGILVDVGSGGGLPGMPIKIAAPELEATLVESTAKKVYFLRRAVETLSIEGTTITNARVEEIARTEAYRGAYDIATARAVARLSVVAEYCVPLLKVGGYVISMKGRPDDDEISEGERAAEKLGARVSTLRRVSRLPEIEEKERCLVILEKVEETPGEYPRKVGVPAKKPLGVV